MLYVWLMVASVWAGLASPLGLQPAPDWVLEDEDVPPPARRITPKSVFVAPTFSDCDPGYRHDPIAGRCVRIVKVNQKAQWDFFLSRLNAMYAQPTKQKIQTGPLHLALPIEPVTTATRTVPSSTAPPPTTTDTPPTTTVTLPPTTTSVPDTTTSYPETTVVSTTLPSTTTYPTSTDKTFPTSTVDQWSTTTDLPPSTDTTDAFSTTPPTTAYTDSQETTFTYSTTESATDYTETSTYFSAPTETTETITEYSTFPEPVSVPSNQRRVVVKPKPKCPPSVRQVGEYVSSDGLDCETETVKPAQYVRFPAPTYSPRRKVSYVRFPDRTWQSSYWWTHNSRPSWDNRHVPLPSSYQKIQHFHSWQRGRPSWADTSLTV